MNNNNRHALQNSPYKKLLIDITFIVTACTVIVYIIGWSYLFTLFNNFKIDVATIDFSLDYILVQGFFSLLKYILPNNKWIGIGFIILLIIYLLCEYIKQPYKDLDKKNILADQRLPAKFSHDNQQSMGYRTKQRSNVGFSERLPKVIVFIVILFLVLNFGKLIIDIGSEAARKEFIKHRTNNFEDYPRTKVWLNSDTLELEILKKLSLGCYRLFFHKDNTIFLFDPNDSNDKNMLNILEVKTDGNNVVAMQIQNWTYPYNCK